jgi:hypothetical protein
MSAFVQQVTLQLSDTRLFSRMGGSRSLTADPETLEMVEVKASAMAWNSGRLCPS